MPVVPPLPTPRSTAPNLIVRSWWKRNIVIVATASALLVVVGILLFTGSSKLLFLLSDVLFKKNAPPTQTTKQPTPPTVIPPTQTIGDVIVPAEVGEDNFYLKPIEFDSMGMGRESEISLTSKVDMDTKAVLFHLSLDPVFDYEVVKNTPREIRIKPKQAFISDGLYRFRLETSYKDSGGVTTQRVYKWGYQAKQNIAITQTMPNTHTQSVSTNTSLLLTFNTDDIDPGVLEHYVDIQPSLRGRFLHHWNQYLFAPTELLKPQTQYTITVKKGLSLQHSSSILLDDVILQFQTGNNNTSASLSNPDQFIPINDRILPGWQEERARQDFGWFPLSAQPINTPPPVNEDTYHDVLQLSLHDPIPFDTLPPSSTMNVFVVPSALADLWHQTLLHLKDHNDDIHGVVSEDLVKHFFEQHGTGITDIGSLPSQTDGGTSIHGHNIGYPSDDVSVTELLALIAYSDSALLSNDSLKQYFQSLYNSYDATASQRAQAAFGLASLGEPYIQQQVNLLNDPHLTVNDRIYLGLGLDRLGATEYTTLIYRDILKDYRTTWYDGAYIATPHTLVAGKYTTLLTALAGFTLDREDMGLRRYIDADHTTEGTLIHTLYDLNRILREPITSLSFDTRTPSGKKNITLDSTHRIAGIVVDVSQLKNLTLEGDADALRLLISY